MRIGLVSDMHGNAVAFRTVLADLEARDPSLIVSPGDVAQGGAQPGDCVDLLQELGCPCVYGNSDDYLLTLDFGSEEVEDEEQRQRLLTTAHWSREQLGEDGLAFLESFQPTVNAGRLLCCHATPHSNEDVILPATSHEDVERVLEGVAADAVATGHVHLQWLRRIARMRWV